MKNRYFFIDNLRWVVVLLVLIYHVFYNFNAVGVIGGIGGFATEQWQDVVCTTLNPWFMTLLFVLAGASSRYALQRRTTKEFRRERTRKLLVPATIGMLFIGAVLGWINTTISGGWDNMPEGMPLVVKYFILVISGTGPLWFIQDLFIFSLLLLAVRKVASGERIDKWLAQATERSLILVVAGLMPLIWGVAQSHIDNPSMILGIANLYRPIYYFVVFLVGYYILSSESLHEMIARRCWWFIAVAAVTGVVFCTKLYGADYTSPTAIQSLWCNLYCWAMTMAMIGSFKRWYDRTSPFAGYMTRSSYGLYIVHMIVCSSACLILKGCGLPVWSIYGLAIAATFVGSVVLWEILRRITFIRWCVFGIKKS